MSELSSAIKQVCEEKGLSYDAVLGTIESALAAAYRKDFGEKNQNIKVEFDPETMESKVFDVKTVVEDVPEESFEEGSTSAKSSVEKPRNKEEDEEKKFKSEKEKSTDDSSTNSSQADSEQSGQDDEEEERKFNPKTDIQLSDAKEIKKSYKVGDEIVTPLEIPEGYGRMAAQTAKQVIIQRLREAEREMVFDEFKDKEGEVVSGIVQRREGRVVLVDLGKSAGVLPQEEQIYGEKYNPGDRIKVYIKEVRLGSKGAEVVLSRKSEEILKKILYLEIPEISNGLVELKGVAREAGSRSKIAVTTDSENVDPIGSCVGQRGARIQTIIKELGGEKVDIIEWDEDPVTFISNALSPAKILNIELNEEEAEATVKVATDQLSLAIGKNGQNARLAARLTGWKIDIVEDSSASSEETSSEAAPEEEKGSEANVEGEDKAEGEDTKEEVDESKEESSDSSTEEAK